MFQSYDEVKSTIASGTTIVSIVESYLSKIEENKNLNAFLEVFSDSSLQKARQVDDKIKSGSAGRLAGMVIGIKDNLCYEAHKVSASSKILSNFESMFTGTAVQRLLDEDAIIIGRLNCDEFAMGSSNENSAFGNVKNPIDLERVPGGSSGGSAAAVAAGLCLASLGSDTGGSIRQPASFTGTIGLKPTYGRISRHGLIAYASSFDQIGSFSKSMKDTALLLEVMSGPDKFDSTAALTEVDDYSNFSEKKPRKIALIKECLELEGINPEIRSNLLSTIENLKSEGHSVEMVSFPYLDYMVPAYYVLTTAEASSNLSRFDGVHYGYRNEEAQGVEEVYKKSRSIGFGPEVKRRIMAGTFVLSQGYYDAYYTKAQKVRRVLKNKTEEIFNNYDFILLPTTPDVAFKTGELKDPITMYLQDIFTVHANLTGNPAISIPKGVTSQNLPFGLQLIGKQFKEKDLLSFSNEIMNLEK